MLTTPTDLARSILESAPDAMIIVDASGAIRFANRQVSALFQYGHDQLVGRPVEELLPDRFRERHRGYRAGYGGSGRVRPMGLGLDLYGLRRDGTEFPVEISLSPIKDGDQTLVAAAIRDVSERKRAEAELITARESADRANLAKSRFLATASHDLRQPLQSLALLNGTLRRLVAGGDATEAVVQQEHAISAMTRLLNALLDIAKLESGSVRPEFRHFQLAGMLEQLRSEFSGVAASKSLELRVDSGAESVYSDPALVEQILRNLLSNALKYTHAGFVRMRGIQANDAVAVEIQDSGVGIAKSDLAQIYDEFYQVGIRTNSSRDGYGLGLSIVRRLVDLLGARLDVSSEIGVGSTFTLTLPRGQLVDRNAAPRGVADARPDPSERKVRVILVEDDPAVLAATRLLLAVEGFDVTAVSSRSEALAAVARRGHPDLLITDFHLRDGETGSDVVAAMRETCGRTLKAVLITGDTSSAISDLPRDPLIKLASKPIEAEALLGLVRTLLAS